MAQRDRSQGFGFVYVDLAKLLATRSEAVLQDKDAQIINFNKDPQPAPVPQASDSSATPQVKERANAMHQIRQNLDRLQRLHHKLHAMLEELNHITGEKKKA